MSLISKIELWACAFDAHGRQDGFSKAWKAFTMWVQANNPDGIILGGDFADNTALSHWDKDKRLKLEGQRYSEECDVLNRELDFLARHTKKIIYIEGNHENWTEQYIERNPELQGIIDLPIMLKLKSRGIEWVPLNKLYNIGKMYFTHGFACGDNVAKLHLYKLGCNIVVGHAHRATSYQMTMQMQHPIMAWSLGWLGDPEKCEYLRHKPSNWIHQFGVLEVNRKSGNFSFLPMNIINNTIIFHGREYSV